MAVFLSYAGQGLELPDALSWADEFSWAPIQQAQTYTSEGALYIEDHVKLAGRPITLEGTENRTWCSRALVETLRTWAMVPSIEMELTIRGVTRHVTFDHAKGALQGFPVMFYADSAVANDDPYVPTLRLLEI